MNRERHAALVQTEERSLPARNGGAVPTMPLQFSPCHLKDVSEFIKKHHYSHTYPGGVDYAFKLAYGDVEIAGAAIFGHMAGNPKASLVVEGYNDPTLFRELMRLVLLDDVPKNGESQFIGWCIRWLKKHTNIVALISFADPKYGHRGTIYKASNWIYCGLQKPDRPRLIIGGQEMHPRQAYSVFGTSSVQKLKKMGVDLRTAPREPKFRYIYLLRPGLQIKENRFGGKNVVERIEEPV